MGEKIDEEEGQEYEECGVSMNMLVIAAIALLFLIALALILVSRSGVLNVN